MFLLKSNLSKFQIKNDIYSLYYLFSFRAPLSHLGQVCLLHPSSHNLYTPFT